MESRRYRRASRLASTAMLLAFTLAGSVGAQPQHQQHHPGGTQASEAQVPVPGTAGSVQGPAGEQMPGMMEHMQGMMRHMQGMMRGMMGRGGMMADETARAADTEAAAPMPPSGMMERGGMMMGRGGMDWHQVERLSQQLDLTEEQRTKVEALVRAHMQEAIRLKAEIAIKRLDVGALVAAEPVDMSKAKALLQSIAALETDLHLAHLMLRQDINTLLTPEQQHKFRAMRRRMMHQHGGMMGRGATSPSMD